VLSHQVIELIEDFIEGHRSLWPESALHPVHPGPQCGAQSGQHFAEMFKVLMRPLINLGAPLVTVGLRTLDADLFL
jgi:hypothetical protein